MILFLFVIWLIFLALLVGAAYVAYIVRHSGRSCHVKRQKIRACIVMGSGGHTTEMCHIVKSLSNNYSNTVFILADTDRMSEDKVVEIMNGRSDYSILRIPRSREVGQSYISSLFTTAYAFFYSVKIVWNSRPDVLLTNGPGTCIPLCIAASLFDMCRLRNTVILFVESICRVQSLSLSGAILYFSGLADDVIVQWPDLKRKYQRVVYIGDIQ